jgi:hypothetical membrane protein
MSQSASIGQLLRHPATSAESKESLALLAGAAAFVVGLIVGLIVFWDRAVPISGPGSLGTMVAITSAVLVFFTVLGAARIVRARRTDEQVAASATPGRRLHWWDIIVIALAHALIALLGWIGMATVLEASFIDAVLYTWSAAMLAGVGVAVAVYAAYLSIVGMTPMKLSLVLAGFLIVGALASMLSASDPHWWMMNLSSLGMTDDISAKAFNLTLIVSGVLVTTIANYATSWLPSDTPKENRGRAVVRAELVVIGIFLACVGIFPVDEFLEIHNTVATGMAIIFVIMVIGLRWQVPSMPKVFFLLGYVFIAVIVVIASFFLSGYYNLTAVELVAGVLVFSWVIIFLRNTGAVKEFETVTE